MITPCNAANNGRGTLSVQNSSLIDPAYSNVDPIPYEQMTPYIAEVPGTTNVPTASGVVAATVPIPRAPQMTDRPVSASDPFANLETPPENPARPQDVLPDAPYIQVPANPLLPPAYQEVIDYENLQYMNGFLRTQIGKYMRVEQLVGSSLVEDRYGYLVGVGVNYILLQEIGTGNITALDYYNIKFVYIYYAKTDLPRNGSK